MDDEQSKLSVLSKRNTKSKTLSKTKSSTANNERRIKEKTTKEATDSDRRGRKCVRAKHKDCKSKYSDMLRSSERSKRPTTPHPHDQQLRMKMCNEASPSKPSTSSVHISSVRMNSADGDDISIHSDEESNDSDGLEGIVNLSTKKCTPASATTMKEVLSSTPNIVKKKMPSRKKGSGRKRKSKQLRRKSSSLSRSRASISRHW